MTPRLLVYIPYHIACFHVCVNEGTRWLLPIFRPECIDNGRVGEGLNTPHFSTVGEISGEGGETH